MPYNGVGQFTSLGAPIFPAVPNTFILASYFNSTMNDVFLGLSGVMTRDGQAPATANLPMAGFTLTGVASAVANGQPLAYGQSGAKLNEVTIDALLTIPDAASVTLAGDLTATATSTADYTLGTIRVGTQTPGDSTTKVASTAFVANAITSLPGGSLPSLTGAAGQALVVNSDEATVSWEKRAQGDLIGESTSSVAVSIATGKVFTVPSGKSWAAAQTVIAYYNATNYMTCTVVSYSGTTLTVDCTAITGSGTYASWAIYPETGVSLQKYPIFSTAAAAATPATSMESLSDGEYATGLSSGSVYVLAYGSSLFLASCHVSGGASSTIATSPDGITWTVRTMPSSAQWAVGSDGGSNNLATANGATTIAKSSNGTTWTSGTALPGVARASYGVPIFNGSIVGVLASAASTLYTSSDNGTTWGTQTIPASPATCPIALGGLFWVHISGTSAYTSPTGATGTWTARTLPITPNAYWQDFDGSLIIGTSPGTAYYKSTDGINWVALTVPSPIADYTDGILSINGVYFKASAAFGSAKTYHKGKWVTRVTGATFAVNASSRSAKNTAATIFVCATSAGSGLITRIAPTEATTATALFSR